MRISTDPDRALWDETLAPHAHALQQDWAYGAGLEALGAEVRRAAVYDDDDRLVALAQFSVRRTGNIMSLALCTRGPVWLAELTAEQKAQAYKALKTGLGLGWPRAVMFTPDDADVPRKAGMKRVMTGYSTVLLDLTQELDALRAGFDGKWRNRLVAAEKSGLKVSPNGTKLAQYRWLLETEEGQQKARGYRATPAQLVPAYLDAKPDRKAALILRADRGKEKIAAMIFLIHGAGATYHIGWNSDDGRKAGAHNLVFWSALAELKERGVTQLDLGGVNTTSGAGIARFKIGTGGEVVTYAGTFF